MFPPDISVHTLCYLPRTISTEGTTIPSGWKSPSSDVFATSFCRHVILPFLPLFFFLLCLAPPLTPCHERCINCKFFCPLCLASLNVFQEILGGPHAAEEKYDAEFFKKFRSQNIVLSARDYARVTLHSAVITSNLFVLAAFSLMCLTFLFIKCMKSVLYYYLPVSPTTYLFTHLPVSLPV